MRAEPMVLRTRPSTWPRGDRRAVICYREPGRTAMNLNALGYVGIRTKNLDDWADYGTRFLGMQLVDKSRGTLALRMDDRKQRVIVHTDDDEGPSFYGWEIAGSAELDALAAHLEKSGVRVARGSRALADERRVKDLIVFADPIGNRLAVFHGSQTPPG